MRGLPPSENVIRIADRGEDLIRNSPVCIGLFTDRLEIRSSIHRSVGER